MKRTSLLVCLILITLMSCVASAGGGPMPQRPDRYDLVAGLWQNEGMKIALLHNGRARDIRGPEGYDVMEVYSNGYELVVIANRYDEEVCCVGGTFRKPLRGGRWVQWTNTPLAFRPAIAPDGSLVLTVESSVVKVTSPMATPIPIDTAVDGWHLGTAISPEGLVTFIATNQIGSWFATVDLDGNLVSELPVVPDAYFDGIVYDRDTMLYLGWNVENWEPNLYYCDPLEDYGEAYPFADLLDPDAGRLNAFSPIPNGVAIAQVGYYTGYPSSPIQTTISIYHKSHCDEQYVIDGAVTCLSTVSF